VARSTKERTWEALQAAIKTVYNSLKINNWVALQDEFDALNRGVERAATLVTKEGLPRFYVRALVTLEDAVAAVGRGDLKKMSHTNAKAHTRVKMTLRKNNEKYTAAIAAYRAAPDAPEADAAGAGSGGAAGGAGGKAGGKAAADDDSDEEIVIGRGGVTVQRRRRASTASSSGSSDDSGSTSDSSSAAPAAKKATGGAVAGGAGGGGGAAGGGGGGDDTDKDTDFDGGSDSDSSESSVEPGVTGRMRWVKRAVDEEKKKVKPVVKPHAPSAKIVVAPPPAPGMDAAALATLDVAALEKNVTDTSGILGREWSREALEARVMEELTSRGRRGADPRAIATRLGALAEVAVKFGPATALPTLLLAVSSRFDLARGLDTFQDRASWKRTARDLATVASMLAANPDLRLAPVRLDDLEAAMARRVKASTAPVAGAEGDEKKEAAAAAPAAALSSTADANPNVVRVVGEVAVLVERLHDEYIKSLQHMDPHKADYVVRIGDEQSVASVAEAASKYYLRAAAAAEAEVAPLTAAAAGGGAAGGTPGAAAAPPLPAGSGGL